MLNIQRKTARLVLMPVVVLMNCAGCHGQDRIGKGASPAAAVSTSVSATPLSLTIERVDAPDTVVRIRIILANRGSRAIVVGEGHSPFNHFEFLLLGPQDQPVPPTAWGRQVLNPIEDSWFTRTIPPGHSRVTTIELSRFFDFTVPGQYQVTVRRRVPPGQVLESQAIVVSIPVVRDSLSEDQ